MKLELKDISKSFTEGKVILDNISLSIEDGDFVVFLGPSGCGKTTLLRIIAGLETEDFGDILFDTVRMNNVEPKDRHIGMVFQNYALYPHMSVFENISFPLKINKVKRSEIKTRVENVAEFIGLSEYLDYKPKQLSGGQRQRVALGRAISRNPKLFLFDEPLSNLDAKLRAQLRTELYNLHRKLKTTSIYVTHDQVEAMTMGDKIVVLNNGKIQQIDTPHNIYENPSNLFVASFVGSPQINLMEGTLTEGKKVFFRTNENQQSNIHEITLQKSFDSEKVNEQEIIFAVRPENLAIKPIYKNSHPLGTFEVYSVEFMGNETIVYFNINSELKSMRTHEKVDLKSGETFELFLNLDKILIFDKLTENKIY